MPKKTENHSKNYDKVRDYYKGRYWSIERVRRAVFKGWISKDEFKEITGKDYE